MAKKSSSGGSKRIASYSDGAPATPNTNVGNAPFGGGPRISGRGSVKSGGDIHPSGFGGAPTVVKRPVPAPARGSGSGPGQGATTPVSGATEGF